MPINREALLRCLESVGPGLSQKDILEQSASFVLSEGEAFTFNDEIACRRPSPLPDEISGAVHAAKLLDCLRKLPDEEIEASQEDGELMVAGKRDKNYVRMEAEILLPIDLVEKPKEWKPLHSDFCEAVGVVGRSCSSGGDQSQLQFVCVHIHPKWVEACDRHQVCRWRMKTGIGQSTLVRQASVKHIVSLGMSEFAETAAWLHFRNADGLVLSCRRYLEEYLPLDEHFGVEGGVSGRLPKGLAKAVDRASVFSSENAEGNRLLVELKPGRVKLSGWGVRGRYVGGPWKAEYDGEPISFLISPEMLTEIVAKHDSCQLTPDRLRIDGGKWLYVACLAAPQAEGEKDQPAADGYKEDGEKEERKPKRKKVAAVAEDE